MCLIDTRSERGQVVVLFALMIPMLLALGGAVVGIGNWYTHAKHLQTKADAGAFAAASAWDIPCDANVDAAIESAAREYVGPHTQADGTPYTSTSLNPQVGGVGASQVHVVLNGSDWYDNDSNPAPGEFDAPSGPVCEARTLDVKVTEDNSFPLASLIPLFPDIKRKARVELRQVEGISGLLPFAVRTPEPKSAAAVFYNESSPTKQILAVRYFVEASPPISGLPVGLRGYRTVSAADVNIASSKIGVVVATSVRGACDTNAPLGVDIDPAPLCFEDNPATPFGGIDQLCNQAGGNLVRCFYAPKSGSTQTVRSGLHFVRGYADTEPGSSPPAVEEAWLTGLTSASCPGSGYLHANLATDCQAQLDVTVDLGDLIEDVDPDPVDEDLEQTRIAGNFEVRYKLVRPNGTVVCNFGPSCSLQKSVADSATGEVTFTSQGTPSSPHITLPPGSTPTSATSIGSSVAIEIRMKGSSVTPNDPDCSPQRLTFADTCRWFYTGNGNFGPSTAPSAADIHAAPIQRSFVSLDDAIDHTAVFAGPVHFLRLAADTMTPDAATQQIGTTPNFVVELGLAGALADPITGQSEPPIPLRLTGPGSQRSILDCNPNIAGWPARDDVSEEIFRTCSYFDYTRNIFNHSPPCKTTPGENHYWLSPPGAGPGPGPPWEDEWEPITCIFTKTGNFPEELVAGLQKRILGAEGVTTCPDDDAEFVRGRNYWNDANNNFDATDKYAFPHFHAEDPRVVTLFVTEYDSFSGSGNTQLPIVDFGVFYITGWGKIVAGGTRLDGPTVDPCPGNDEPPALLNSGQNGGVVWGHFISDAVPVTTGSASDELCEFGQLSPCVAVLVE
jgi:Flp pilus assembly protein TadG